MHLYFLQNCSLLIFFRQLKKQWLQQLCSKDNTNYLLFLDEAKPIIFHLFIVLLAAQNNALSSYIIQSCLFFKIIRKPIHTNLKGRKNPIVNYFIAANYWETISDKTFLH
jgi:hypothetical protein